MFKNDVGVVEYPCRLLSTFEKNQTEPKILVTHNKLYFISEDPNTNNKVDINFSLLFDITIYIY